MHDRSSPPDMFLIKGVLKICSKFTGQHPCRNVIPIKFLCNVIEITLRHGCSPVNLVHIFITPPKIISGGLLLVWATWKLISYLSLEYLNKQSMSLTLDEFHALPTFIWYTDLKRNSAVRWQKFTSGCSIIRLHTQLLQEQKWKGGRGEL